ncbi:MAG: AAA-like domain-containing protein [Caldilineaceae bacterium]|nr:AAA-like domain-containing protein [Caldilineaceae bacterium]
MQSPYVVGRWVRGAEHYDRQGLIEYLLAAPDTAIWVVGTRRMGKTSLLRQIELVTAQERAHLVPLFWDLQGCTDPATLTLELFQAIEDAVERFADLDLDFATLRHEDAVDMLRRLGRALVRQGRQLLLLMDEAEVLVQVAQIDPAWLARLRKALQEGHLRTIITSTRLLTQLTDQSAGWMTSPFLFGFHLVRLCPLRQEGAANLAHQSQGDCPVTVEPAVLDAILRITNHHPYLVQYLCERLYVPGGSGCGMLRAPADDDLVLDHILTGLFVLDYQHLDAVERRLLLTVVEADVATSEHLAAAVGPAYAVRLPELLRGLQELGHLRQVAQGWTVGSEFLRRWLRLHLDEFRAELDAAAPPALAPAQTAPDSAPAAASAAESAAEPPLDLEAAARALRVSADRLRALEAAQIHSEAEFFDVVCSFFVEIRHLVEQDEGYRMLVHVHPEQGVALKSEEEIQIALMHWLRPMCRALNIDMNRESLTGRGLLDFKFSIGHDFRCLVEVKLYQSAKLAEGLGTQLPIYLLADKSRYGVYVPIFLESADYAGRVAALQALAAARDRSHGVTIEVIDIRAWRPKSASKADGPDDPDRYRLDPRPRLIAARLQARRPENPSDAGAPSGLSTDPPSGPKRS